MKKIMIIALAYVGVLTGAGLASGQELLQYFTAFGKKGLIGVLLAGVLHALVGGAILQLGSYFRADDHQQVLDEIAPSGLAKFLDIGLVITCFVVGFVMIAGAGSNLHQQYGLAPWIGSAICVALTIVIGMMDFKKVAQAIGAFTPVIVAFIAVAAIYTLWGFDGDWDALDAVARTIPTNLPNWQLSMVNYFAMCMITGTSMALVLGGSVMYPKKAKRSGLIGGGIVGVITALLGFTLFVKVDAVKDADLPLQLLVSEIHPAFGVIMSVVIYGMIFNTCISLFYALASRFSGGDDKRFKWLLVGITLVGYAVSFLGFKRLISIMYPILGYMGMVLIATLIYGWAKRKRAILREDKKRHAITQILARKHTDTKKFTPRDQERLEAMAEDAHVDLEDIDAFVKEVVEFGEAY